MNASLLLILSMSSHFLLIVSRLSNVGGPESRHIHKGDIPAEIMTKSGKIPSFDFKKYDKSLWYYEYGR